MMANAIHDDSVRADRGTARRPRNACAIGAWPSQRGAPRPGPAAARRRLQLRDGRRADRVQFADDRVVEAALHDGRDRRIDGSPSGSKPTVLTPALEARIMAWTRGEEAVDRIDQRTPRCPIETRVTPSACPRVSCVAALVLTRTSIILRRFERRGSGGHRVLVKTNGITVGTLF